MGSQGPTGPQGAAGTDWGEEAAFFDGFTAATYDGAQGGREAMHALCDAEFLGSHLCHSSEYLLANSDVPPPVGTAWIDFSCGVTSSATGVVGNAGSARLGRSTSSNTSRNCSNWTSASALHEGLTVQVANMVAGGQLCSTPRSLACCGSVFAEVFAGFTSTYQDGDMGGRHAAHAACAAEFTASHLCHVTEYQRAHPVVSPPVGAWLDFSGALMSNSSQVPVGNCAAAELGRYGASTGVRNCSGWTSASGGDIGLAITATGAVSGGYFCSTPRPLACCL